MTPFGFSAGDFVAGVSLVKELIAALEESSGSGKGYRDLIRELYGLERALLEVKALEVDAALQTQKRALEQVACQCQETISQFLDEIGKYHSSLSLQGSGSGWRDALRKVQWALCKKEEVQGLRARIQAHTSSIQTLLVTLQLQEAALQRAEQQKALSQGNSSSLRSMQMAQCLSMSLAELVPAVRGCLTDVSSSLNEGRKNNDELQLAIREICGRNQQIYQTVLNMQNCLPPQVERQQPVYFLDARGFMRPFHLEFITCWEAFEDALKYHFQHVGRRKVERGEYLLSNSQTRQVINREMPWARCFRPGLKVDMDMVFLKFNVVANWCPLCEEKDGTVWACRAAQCHNGNIWLRMLSRRWRQELAANGDKRKSIKSRLTIKGRKDVNIELNTNDNTEDDISNFNRVSIFSVCTEPLIIAKRRRELTVHGISSL